jgi:hypothetical protein
MVRRSPQVESEILARLSAGETLRKICRDDHMPDASAVVQWCDADPNFAQRYARARSEGLEVLADELLEISDDTSRDPNCRKVAIDSRKWLLSKLKPKKYGDVMRQELSGPDGGAIMVDDAKERLRARIAGIATRRALESGD